MQVDEFTGSLQTYEMTLNDKSDKKNKRVHMNNQESLAGPELNQNKEKITERIN